MGWDPREEVDRWGQSAGNVVEDLGPAAAIINPALGLTNLGPATGAYSGVDIGSEGLENVGSGVTDVYHDISGQTAAEAAKAAGATQASAMMEQLNYLKEINRLPQQYKEQALTELAGLYGEDGAGNQQALIDRAKASPLYQQIMGGQKMGEEAVMRNASQTGGLRSGNVQSAMYDYGTQLSNQALTQSYDQQLQGLRGLAGLPTNENQIGQTMADVGTAQGQAILGQASAQQQGTQNMINLGLGIGGMIL